MNVNSVVAIAVVGVTVAESVVLFVAGTAAVDGAAGTVAADAVVGVAGEAVVDVAAACHSFPNGVAFAN